MAERKYQGAGIGVTRMNRILDLLLFKSRTITDITLDLDICDRAARNYLGKLLDMGKITMARGTIDPRFKFYSLVPGAMPIPVPELLRPRSRPLVVEKKKTGPRNHVRAGITRLEACKTSAKCRRRRSAFREIGLLPRSLVKN